MTGMGLVHMCTCSVTEFKVWAGHLLGEGPGIEANYCVHVQDIKVMGQCYIHAQLAQ